jgi:Cft2 family RNA processing exonuclease
MTHPTKAVMRMLLSDYIKLVNVTSEDILYDEKDLARCVEKIELIDYHQVSVVRKHMLLFQLCLLYVLVQ